METIKVNTSQHVAIDYPVAGVGDRIVARLIDLGIFFCVFMLLMVFGVSFASVKSGIAYGILIIIYLAAFVFYNLLTEIFLDGQSVGKKAMKIKVISLDGSQASIGQYFIRWLFRLVDFYLTAQLAGFFCIILSDKKQRIGDMVAGTVMIKTVLKTTFDHIAFHPVTAEDYIPVFGNVQLLGDKDVELIHEVLDTYYKTGNEELVKAMTAKVSTHLSSPIPEDMHESVFLNTVIKDYNHITSRQ